jgi:hypothetical protein
MKSRFERRLPAKLPAPQEKKLMNSIVFVDVDDTLVRSVGTKRIPMPRVIDRIRHLHRECAEQYLWSSGGADYAKESAKALGIADCFLAFLPKPTLIIDDQAVSDWRYCNTNIRCRPSGFDLLDPVTRL